MLLETIIFCALASTEIETPVAVPLVESVTETVTVEKALYESLVKENETMKQEIQRLQQKRIQLLAENDALASEVALWKQRLSRVLRCQTIQEAIEELRAVLSQGERQ
jgi:FtsZ-binding cell division protein ZapB